MYGKGGFFVACVLALMGTAHAAETSDYKILKHNLLMGVRTTSIVELDKCEQTAGDKLKISGAVGGYVINGFKITSNPDESLAYSHSHATMRKDGTPVSEFIRYRVMPNETATVSINVASQRTLEPLMKTKTFTCPLGSGLKFAYKPEN